MNVIIDIVHAQTIANAPTFSTIFGAILSFLLRIFGIIAIIGLVVSGMIYLTAGGDVERISLAKKIFFYSIVGILVAVGSNIIIKQISVLLF